MEVINIEILADGTIKADTPNISAANHFSADMFFAFLQKLCGGEAKRKAKSMVASVHSHNGITHSH